MYYDRFILKISLLSPPPLWVKFIIFSRTVREYPLVRGKARQRNPLAVTASYIWTTGSLLALKIFVFKFDLGIRKNVFVAGLTLRLYYYKLPTYMKCVLEKSGARSRSNFLFCCTSQTPCFGPLEISFVHH